MSESHPDHLDMLRDAKSPDVATSSSPAATPTPEASNQQDTAWQTLPIPPIDGENPQHINRELSWLAFNERVLAEANNPNHPLLERLRFVAISADNLDEFFMVRVAGLKHASARDDSHKMLIDKQLQAMDYRIRHLMRQQQTILPELWRLLGRENIHLVSPDSLTQTDRDYISHYIEEEVIHVITPQTIDPAHPFPFIANRGFGMFLEVANKKGKTRQALIMLPSVLKRFIRLKPSTGEGEGEGAASRFITLEEAILLNLEMIFPRHHLVHHVFFRLLRDSEIDYDEEAEDLVATFENALRARRRGNVIALHLSAGESDGFTSALTNELAVGAHDIHFVGGMIGLADLTQLTDLTDLTQLGGAGEDGLRFPPYTPRFPERIRDYGGDCFAAIRAKDIVVHHPYESFDVVLQFLRQAAEDPQVISIRQTLYRTLPDSPIVRALILAAEAGKSVMAMVEIKARFDEEVNIRLARDLERAGVQVVYGFTNLKTHAKLSLVVRQEEGKLRTYAHCGTGNYHPVNARIYTDLSFFTCESQVCSDIVRIFNYMTSYVKPSKLHKVKFSPVSGRNMFVDAIQGEIKAAKAGKPSGIWLKLNALVDTRCINLLYEASAAGVPIELVVRGICCLRPGIPGQSENIRVRSIIGRFLEHARIYVFANGEPLPSPRASVYISSADLMPRNLDRRVEVFMPIENPTVHRQILDQVMYANINDTSNTWLLNGDGSYVRHPQATPPFSAHHFFMTNPSLSGRGSALESKIGKGAKKQKRGRSGG